MGNQNERVWPVFVGKGLSMFQDIVVVSKRQSKLREHYRQKGYRILDLTSRSAEETLLPLSPFYPIGEVPVPFHEELRSWSVEGVWQALKVFEPLTEKHRQKESGLDLSKLENRKMKGIKRTVRSYGKILGHLGEDGKVLSYVEARIKIYLPTYEWALRNKLQDSLSYLEDMASKYPLVLLDYTSNGDVWNTAQPLSLAALVKQFLETGELNAGPPPRGKKRKTQDGLL